MKRRKLTLSALTCASLLGSAALSQGAIIIQENFDYANGGLDGKIGGTGFGSNVWFNTDATVDTGVAISAQNSGQVGRRNFDATLGTSATLNLVTVLWVRFDWGHSTTVGQNSGYGGLTFYQGTVDGGTEYFLFGNPWNTAPAGEWNISGGTGDQNTGISSNGMKSGVAKFDLTAGTVSLWVRATGTEIDVSDPADASVSGLADLGLIKGIRINGFNSQASQSFDNLTIATTMSEINAIPEPGAALLGGLGLLALLRRRR